MPGPDITRPKNNCAFYFAFLSWAIWIGVLAVVLSAPARARSQAAQAVCPPSQIPLNLSRRNRLNPARLRLPLCPLPRSRVTRKAAPIANSQQSPNQTSTNQDNGTFVIRKDVDEVLLHATVVDDKGHIVTSLNKNDFTVFEDGKPQTIISFHHEDIPVAMGILIDNSGSMREKRAKVNQAALNLVRSSNPQDEVFVVNFNDEYYLDQDFTNDLLKLKEALEKIDARGGTALYEAVVASADHLKRDAKLERKVLFVVTDGEDNASRESLEQAVKQLQEENSPSVYAIGILGDEEHPKRARRALEIIAQRTGGLGIFSQDAGRSR